MKTLLCTLALAGAISAPAASTLTAQKTDADCQAEDSAAPTCAEAGKTLTSAREALQRAFSIAGRAFDGDGAAQEERAREALERARVQQAVAGNRLAAARSLLASARAHEGHEGGGDKELLERLRQLERQLEALSKEIHEESGDEPRVRFIETREPREARSPREPRAPRAPREARQPRQPRQPRAPRAPREPREPRVLFFDSDDECSEGSGKGDCCDEQGTARGFFVRTDGDDEGKKLRYSFGVGHGGDDDDEDRVIGYSFGDKTIWSSGKGSGEYRVEVDPSIRVFQVGGEGDDDGPTIYRWHSDDGDVKVETKVKARTLFGGKHKDKSKSKAKSKGKGLYFLRGGEDDDVETDVSFPHVVQVQIPDIDVRFPEALRIEIPEIAGRGIAHDVLVEIPDIDTTGLAHGIGIAIPDLGDFEIPDIAVLSDVELPDMEAIEIEIPDIEIPDFEFPPIVVPDVELPDGAHGVIEIHIESRDAEPGAAPAPRPSGDSKVVATSPEPQPFAALPPGLALASYPAPLGPQASDESDELLGELVELMRELKTDMGSLQADIRALHHEIDAAAGR